MADTQPWPVEIRLDNTKSKLTVSFENGDRYVLSAEYLRVESPSAEVQGHGASQKQTIGGKRDVRIETIEPVGNYAVRIGFDDGHDTGLYSWDWLHELGRDADAKWKSYLNSLNGKGLHRER